MKKIKPLIMLSIIATSITSCSEESINNDLSNDPYVEVGVSNTALKHIDEYTSFSPNARIDNYTINFDFNNLKALKEKSSGIETIYAYAINVEDENSQYAIGFFENKDHISEPIITRTTTPINGISYIEYYSSNGDKLAEFEVNQDENTTTVTYISEVGSSSRIEGCNGQDVADCVGDAYTDHGWYSVGLFVATAFAPEITLIVVGACGLKECNE